MSTFPGRRLVPALLFPLLAAACGGPAVPAAPSPESVADVAAATITPQEVAALVGALAHDSARGRDTPSPELEKAAEFIGAQFRAMGLQPAGENGTYIDRWTYQPVSLADARLRVEGVAWEPAYAKDFFLVPGMQPTAQAGAYYIGTAGDPVEVPATARGKAFVFDVPVAEIGMEWQQKLVGAIQTAMMNGAGGVVVILDPETAPEVVGQLASVTASQQAPMPIAGITDAAARRLAEAAGGSLDDIRAAGAPVDLEITLEIAGTQQQATHTPPNVVAMLPGSDSTLRDSYVVFTAHFDHDGVGTPDASGDSIFNGADDNASGTVAILEIAEAFASLPAAPARTVVFLAVSGEEKGLLGADAWVEDPTVDIEGVVANINLDMVGRNAPDTIIGIGQEYSSLEGVLQGITAAHPELGLNVILDPKPEEMFFFRSDQLPFIQAGIPAVFFTTGDHEDYHKVTDEADRIDNDKLARVARLGFYLGYAIATDPVKPEWTPEGWQRIERMLQGSPF